MTDSNLRTGLAPESPTSLRKIDFIDYKLENGLRVILHENHKAALVCVNIAYHVGSKDEPQDRKGFAHLFEHLLFEGSRHVPKGAFDVFITQAGGHDNAYTTEDKTNYYEVLPSHQLGLALWLESDRMLEFAISEESLRTQKNVVKEEKRERYDNAPYGSLTLKMNELAYDTYPYRWSVIGDMETIEAASLKDAREFFDGFYSPDNAVLVVTGDIDIPLVKSDIERYFGGLPRRKKLNAAPEYTEPYSRGERRHTISDEPIPLPGVFYGYKIPAEGGEEFVELDLLTDILSSGLSSNLQRRLVYELQIASEVSAFVDGRELPGLLYIYAMASDPDRTTRELEEGLNDVIERVKLNGVTEHELQKAKNKTLARMAGSRVTMQGLADQLAHAAVFYGDPEYVNTMWDRYDAVTTESVKRAAVKYLGVENRCAVIYETNGVLD